MNDTIFFSSINEVLNLAVNRKFDNKLQDLQQQLETLAQDMSLDIDVGKIMVSQKYPIKTVIHMMPIKKTRTKRVINPELQCMARTGLGTQCSRSKIANEDYCGSHCNSRPYGRIDCQTLPENKMIKKRGRRGKKTKEYKLEDLDMSKYVQAILVMIDEDPYLLDQNSVLYKYNTDNEIVGCIVDEEVNWY